MATITGTLTRVEPGYGAWKAVWTALGDADQGSAIKVPMGSEKSFQVFGTFGSATVVLQGSNDGTNWASLTDPQGNAISKTAAALEAVSEHTLYIRPSTSGGTGTNVDVIVFIAGQMT